MPNPRDAEIHKKKHPNPKAHTVRSACLWTLDPKVGKFCVLGVLGLSQPGLGPYTRISVLGDVGLFGVAEVVLCFSLLKGCRWLSKLWYLFGSLLEYDTY